MGKVKILIQFNRIKPKNEIELMILQLIDFAEWNSQSEANSALLYLKTFLTAQFESCWWSLKANKGQRN